jgi:hypothetical protein
VRAGTAPPVRHLVTVRARARMGQDGNDGVTIGGTVQQRCDQCRRPIQGEPVRTATRTLCDACGTTFLGLAAGTMAGNGDVGQSIATAGWFERLRRRNRG